MAAAEIVRALKVKDRVTVTDVCKILTRFQLPNTFDDGRARIESAIASNLAQGSFDGKEFVNKTTLDKEPVHYEIVAKFEFQENGAIAFKCPSCGASLTLQSKEPSGTCKYCGGSYTVPRKLLDMI